LKIPFVVMVIDLKVDLLPGHFVTHQQLSWWGHSYCAWWSEVFHGWADVMLWHVLRSWVLPQVQLLVVITDGIGLGMQLRMHQALLWSSEPSPKKKRKLMAFTECLLCVNALMSYPCHSHLSVRR
jgi:hypothetical protein